MREPTENAPKTRSLQFEELHNRLYGRVFSYVSLRIKDREEVTDLVQEVFLKAYRTWSEIPEESTARQYLFVIARSKIIDYLRSARHRYMGVLQNKVDEFGEYESDFDSLKSEDPLPEEVFEKSENSKKILELLQVLNPLEREIINLRFMEELEYKELSEIYKTSEDNIRKKVSRALQKVKDKNKIKVDK